MIKRRNKINETDEAFTSTNHRTYFILTHVQPLLVQTTLNRSLEILEIYAKDATSIDLWFLASSLVIMVLIYVFLLNPTAFQLKERNNSVIEMLRLIPKDVFEKVATIRNKVKMMSV